MNKAFETQLGRLQVTLLEEPAGDKRSGEGEKVDPSEPAQFPNAVKVVFESYKDGKLFQRDIDTQSVASLHPLFQFDPSLINDIMQGHPDDIQLHGEGKKGDSYLSLKYKVKVCSPLRQDSKRKDASQITLSLSNTRSFAQVMKKTHEIEVKVPAKVYPAGSIDEVLDLKRLLRLERRKLQRVEKIMKKTARQERARLAQTRSKSVVAIPHLQLLAT